MPHSTKPWQEMEEKEDVRRKEGGAEEAEEEEPLVGEKLKASPMLESGGAPTSCTLLANNKATEYLLRTL